MPHFVIDCSEKILNLKSPEEIIQAVYDTAESTALFDIGDIKVRINPFKYYNIGNTQDDFIHIFAHIMEGRNTAQKSDLSKKIVSQLNTMFPNVPIISMNIVDFEKATYCNKSMAVLSEQ
jgi:5-carboxymethyl-2-hydroxymuconate isomerase